MLLSWSFHIVIIMLFFVLGTSRMSVDIEGSKAGSEGATKTEDSIDKDESAAIEKWTNK